MFFLILILLKYQYNYSQPSGNIKDSTYLIINNSLTHKDSILFPYDALDVGFKQIINNDFSFLIEDSSYYNFTVSEIHKLKNGYGILLTSRICDTNTYTYVISRGKGVKNGEKIKVGNTYKMKLTRYFPEPLILSIEYPKIYDVMIGTEIIPVMATGLFSYIFITQNLNGLHYIDSLNAMDIKNEIKDDELRIQDFIYEFINSISTQNDTTDLLSFVDTTSMKLVLENYSITITTRSPDFKSYKPPFNVPSFPWFNVGIDNTEFNSFFKGVIKYFYKLPADYILSEKEVEIFPLYISNDTYTIRVVWKSPYRTYSAILAIKPYGNSFKIIGFNKVV